MCIVRIYILILTVPNGFDSNYTAARLIVRSHFFQWLSLDMNQFITFDRLEHSGIQLAFIITDVFPILSNMYFFKFGRFSDRLSFFFFLTFRVRLEKKRQWAPIWPLIPNWITRCVQKRSRIAVLSMGSNPWFCTKLHYVFRRDARRIAILSMGSNPTLDVFKFRRDAE